MQKNNYPFYYEVRFRFLKYIDNDNFEIQPFVRTFENENPLVAREEAFKEFNEYLLWAEKANRLTVENENYRIIQPAFIDELIEKNESKDYSEYKKKYNSFQQEISIFLVINDIDLVKNIQKSNSDNEFAKMLESLSEELGVYNENEFLIHKVGTSLSEIEEQEMVDNLQLIELKLYDYFKIDTTKYQKAVLHYGLDFFESGEEEDGCQRTILETPHIWSSEERYYKQFKETIEKTDHNNDSDIVSWKEIIEKGESDLVEFKPSLCYNFKYKKATNNVRIIIAKAICAFLNSKGGILFIGVTDKGEIQGLEEGDYRLSPKNVRDSFRLAFDKLFVDFFSLSVLPFVKLRIEQIDGKEIAIIEIRKSEEPVFLKKHDYSEDKEFYIRAKGASSLKINDIEDIIKYIFNNWIKEN